MRRRSLVALLAIATAIGLAACAPAVPGFSGPGEPMSDRPAEIVDPGPVAPPVPSEPESAVDGAVVIGDGGVEIDLWVDFFCPYCRMFDESNGDFLQELVDAGHATLRIHPVAFLDRASMGTAYSTRAANAFVCVAELAPEGAHAFYRRLYEIQPEEGTGGLTDEELIAEAPPAAAECVEGQWFAEWVEASTEQAVEDGIQGTPTVVVGGRPFPGGFDPFEFRDFVSPSTTVV